MISLQTAHSSVLLIGWETNVLLLLLGKYIIFFGYPMIKHLSISCQYFLVNIVLYAI